MVRRLFVALAAAVVLAAPLAAQDSPLAAAAKKAKEDRAKGMGWPAPVAPPETSAATAETATPPTSAAASDAMAPAIRAKCATEWPDDFRMRVFCEKQQHDSLDKITGRNALMKSTPTLQGIRLKCLKEWSTLGPMRNGERTLIVDFKMNNFCEEQQLKALGQLQH